MEGPYGTFALIHTLPPYWNGYAFNECMRVSHICECVTVLLFFLLCISIWIIILLQFQDDKGIRFLSIHRKVLPFGHEILYLHQRYIYNLLKEEKNVARSDRNHRLNIGSNNHVWCARCHIYSLTFTQIERLGWLGSGDVLKSFCLLEHGSVVKVQLSETVDSFVFIGKKK